MPKVRAFARQEAPVGLIAQFVGVYGQQPKVGNGRRGQEGEEEKEAMDEDNARRNHNDKAMERKGTNKEEKKCGERRARGKFKEGRHEIHIGERRQQKGK
jgi:hypothetical protein